MKIGNRTKLFFEFLTVILISAFPVVAGVVVFSEYVSQKSCIEQSDTLKDIELENKPVINCEKQLINLNLFKNKIAQETNNLNFTNFENQNLAKKDSINNDLASLQKYLSESKIPYKLPKTRSFLDIASNYYKLLKDNKSSIDTITIQKNQLDSNMSLLNEEDQKTAKSIISLPGITYISEFKKINELIDKQTTQLLASRDNKASIPDKEYIEEKKKLKIFSAKEFLQLTDQITTIDRPTWNKTIISPEVDKILFDAALNRGYRYRVLADVSQLSGRTQMDINIRAKEALDQLIESGAKNNFIFRIASGHRDPDDQKAIFTSRLDDACKDMLLRSCTTDDFKSGRAAPAIESILKTSSVPTTSKHHTGLTVDLEESGVELTQFKNTESYKYLSSDNFFNAKRFGFVPSYPVGGEKMGPDPEEWEFIYVGVDKLVN